MRVERGDARCGIPPDECASCEGWHEQWVKVPPGKSSYGYRPKRTAHEAVARVARAIVEEKTRIIDLDLKAYFDDQRGQEPNGGFEKGRKLYLPGP